MLRRFFRFSEETWRRIGSSCPLTIGPVLPRRLSFCRYSATGEANKSQSAWPFRFWQFEAGGACERPGEAVTGSFTRPTRHNHEKDKLLLRDLLFRDDDLHRRQIELAGPLVHQH